MSPDFRTDSESATAHVLDVAIRHFSTLGYQDAKLDEIAKEADLSKRMLHYHFGDKKSLYHRSLQAAVAQLRPTYEELELESAVPVEGVIKIVKAVFSRYVQHPESVRLIAMENLHQYTATMELPPLADRSAILLQLDKLLMLGQDAGAFRPGISALDVFTIIASLSVFRINSRSTTYNLYGADLMDAKNTEGMERLVVDTVLAFLTSHIKGSKDVAYIYTTADTEQFNTHTTDPGTYSLEGDLFS